MVGCPACFASALALECAREFLNLGSADRRLPTLCLDVNRIQTELVFFDDSINPAIIGFTNCSSSVKPIAPITHANQEIDNQTFKKGRRVRW